MTVEEQLSELRSRIIHELYVERGREVWFYPSHDGVSGWSGTARIMFVGLAPSTGYFPKGPDKVLYASLKAQGLGNAHLTDALKIRTPVQQVDDLLGHGGVASPERGYPSEDRAGDARPLTDQYHPRHLQPRTAIYAERGIGEDGRALCQLGPPVTVKPSVQYEGGQHNVCRTLVTAPKSSPCIVRIGCRSAVEYPIAALRKACGLTS